MSGFESSGSEKTSIVGGSDLAERWSCVQTKVVQCSVFSEAKVGKFVTKEVQSLDEASLSSTTAEE